MGRREWMQPGTHEPAHREDPMRPGRSRCGLRMTGTGWWPAFLDAQRCATCAKVLARRKRAAKETP
jgi:hypothetical protein